MHTDIKTHLNTLYSHTYKHTDLLNRYTHALNMYSHTSIHGFTKALIIIHK